MKPFRVFEFIVTLAAAAVVANAVSHQLWDTKNFLAGEYYSPLTVLAGTWLLALVFAPKQMPRIG